MIKLYITLTHLIFISLKINEVFLFKFVVFAAFITLSHAGVISPAAYPAPVAYSSAPAVSYSSIAAPAAYAAAPALPYAAPAFAKVAAPVAYAAPVAKTIIAEPDAPANYNYGYSVNDGLTGDSKTHQETRNGDSVQGRLIFSSVISMFH